LDAASGPGPALPSSKQLAWLLVRPTEALSLPDAAAVRRAEQGQEAALVASLARWFTALVRGCDVDAAETFAAGLEQDGVPVLAALTQPWSSG
jgi:hypothetical protein